MKIEFTKNETIFIEEAENRIKKLYSQGLFGSNGMTASAEDLKNCDFMRDYRGYIGTVPDPMYTPLPVYISPEALDWCKDCGEYVAEQVVRFAAGDRGIMDYAYEWRHHKRNPLFAARLQGGRIGVYPLTSEFWGDRGAFMQVIHEYDFFEARECLRVYVLPANIMLPYDVDRTQLDAYDYLGVNREEEMSHLADSIRLNLKKGSRLSLTNVVGQGYGRYTGLNVNLSGSVIDFCKTYPNLDVIADEIALAIDKYTRLESGLVSRDSTNSYMGATSCYLRSSGDTDFGFVIEIGSHDAEFRPHINVSLWTDRNSGIACAGYYLDIEAILKEKEEAERKAEEEAKRREEQLRQEEEKMKEFNDYVLEATPSTDDFGFFEDSE